ncbi:transposase [Ruegeria pomeroyi]|uniref:Transposase n=1 Tax=Ruegeria pomeroyi TaxID=89184 RepID=A0A9Q3WKT5_9RHOB|nr:transposase [Ruegeria pomeroyi]MCE8537896.1 transposase [Ruegeria pomeroyi]
MSEIEITTDGGRRRRCSAAEKLRIVGETPVRRGSISAVARRNGVAPHLLCIVGANSCWKEAVSS